MLDNDELVIIENRFSKINLGISIMLLIYRSLFWVFDYESLGVDTVIFCSVIFVFVIEYILSRFSYWSSDFIYKLIKFLELLLIAIITLRSNKFELSIIIFSILYYVIAFEVKFTFDLTENYSLYAYVFFVWFPLMLVTFFKLVIGEQSNFWAFVIVVFAILFSGFIGVCAYGDSYVLDRLYKKINSLSGLASTSIVENDSMKVMQIKLVNSNEQLSKQRFELEKANEKITKNNEEMKLQSEILKSISNNLKLTEVTTLVTNSIMNNLKCDFVHIALMSDKYDGMYVFDTKFNMSSGITRDNLCIIESEKFIKEICDKDQFVLHEDFANVKCSFLNGTNMKSFAVFPGLINNSENVLLLVGFCEVDAFHDKMNFYTSIKNQINMSLSNAFLYYEMELMATKDALTGIYNRRYFNSLTNQYNVNYINKNENITVVLFDIDKFKSINDTYGHIFGDEVISFCGGIANEFTKKYKGLPVRYGGEEFVLVFPNKNYEEVNSICELMHSKIKEKVFKFDSKDIRINVSIGISSFGGRMLDFEDVLNCADEAMYYSKEHGRGRITLYRDICNEG